MKYALRMTGVQHRELHSHLFPGDGNEAVALLLCGRRSGDERHVFTAKRTVIIPHERCQRRPDRITWPTEFLDSLWPEARKEHLAIAKVHSHTSEYSIFPLQITLRTRRFSLQSGAFSTMARRTRVSSCFRMENSSGESLAMTAPFFPGSLRSWPWATIYGSGAI